jgi:site-specific recombinase XerD
MAQLSRWLVDNRRGVVDLSAPALEEFVAWRGAVGYVSAVSSRRVSQVVGYLVSTGAAAVPVPPATRTPVGDLVERYRGYLVSERGLAGASVRAYAQVAEAFLSSLPSVEEPALEALGAAEVAGFLLEELRRTKVASAKATTTRLRSLLRFLYVEGLTARALDGAVPPVASWQLASLPKGLPAADVARLLGSCDRRRPLGLRDFAVLNLLSRLGLRAAEVAGLQLYDISWRSGELTVHGKGGRTDRLPLPVEVGEAVVAWLERGRPRCRDRSVFVRSRAPHSALTPRGVSMIVWHACQRAGLAPVGAHRLRHTVATDMLRAGGSLDEVGQVLRHQRRATTQQYAKVDRRALSAVARPWPGAQP